MSLQDIDIKDEYRVPRDNIVNDFYLPILSQAVKYDRSVGYFSSDALIKISYGICQLIKNGGKIRLIVSPNLSEEDYNAINSGYKKRKEIIEKRMVSSITTYENYFQNERFNLISELIAQNLLDIKIAFSYNKGKIGLYHEKMGLIYDDSKNIISFTGSMNETETGMSDNYETIDVFKSWDDMERVENKLNAFENLWKNEEKGAITFKFPDAVKKEIIKHNTKNANYNIDQEEIKEIIKEYNNKVMKYPKIPENITLRPYQTEAIKKWKDHNYIGIFDMATGTGKTITGLSAIINLLNNENMKLGIIICVPYLHLVDQWYKDLKSFNFNPIIGYSNSPQRKWKIKLKRAVFEYSNNVRDNFCFLTTNKSFASSHTYNVIKSCKKKLLLVVDEAHNFGSSKLLKLLDKKLFTYRLALSATFERHLDEYGTNVLYDFFGEKCINYTLKEAIDEEMLCKYFYYPIPIYLEKDELEEYNVISLQIKNALKYIDEDNYELTDIAKRLLIKRSRIIAGARNKIPALKKEIEKYKNDHYILVYCGATQYYGDSDDKNSIRQIQKVQEVLNKELNMACLQFTSEESSKERQMIIDNFQRGDSCQVLVSMKCLDEGVNIPKIRIAFILASSTNPKEYIQRRGRVLRTAKGKDFAYIYDFITLPRDLHNIKNNDDMEFDSSLIIREVSRMIEFSKLSLNPYSTDKLVEELFSIYGAIVYNEEKEGYVL